MSVEKRFDIERQYRDLKSTQARLSGSAPLVIRREK